MNFRSAILFVSVAIGLVLADPGLWIAHAQGNPPPTEPHRWRNVSILGGGFVTGITFSPAEEGLVYARTDIGGAYRWDALGKQWVPLTDWVGWSDSNLLGIESLAVDPSDPDRVYLAAGTYTQSWAGRGAILRSTDRGRTWLRTDMLFKMGGNEDGRSIGERLAVDPNDGRTLYFGSRHDSLWRSTDHGISWAKISSFPTADGTNRSGIGFVLYDSRSGAPGQPSSTIYAGTDAVPNSLYRSTDTGTTWLPVPGQPQPLAPQVLIPHHAAFDSAGVLYVTYCNGPGPNGVTGGEVWKLDTATGTWTRITPPITGEFGWAGLAVDLSHPGTVMVTTLDRWWPGDEIYRTTDGGQNWTPLGPRAVRDSSASPYLNWGGTSAALGHWIGDIEIDPFNPDHALYVTGATIWGTNDLRVVDSGATSHWTPRTHGFEETAVLDLISPPDGAHLLSALGDLGAFRHDDLSSSPSQGMARNPIFSTATSLDFAEAQPNFIARVGYGGNIPHGAYSSDGGATWTPFPAEPPGANHEAGTIAVSADGETFVWTPNQGSSFHSSNRGATWVPCAGLPANLKVISDRVNPGQFYALNRATGDLYMSIDRAASFTVKGRGMLKYSDGKLRAEPGREDQLWVTAGTGGLILFDAGPGVAFSVGGVNEAFAVGFGAPMPGYDETAIYLVGKVEGVRGAFRYDRGPARWTRINDDTHQYGWIGQVITGDPRIPGRVYLGTNGRGILFADPIRPKWDRRRLRQ